jgi:hypothetical protein
MLFVSPCVEAKPPGWLPLASIGCFAAYVWVPYARTVAVYLIDRIGWNQATPADECQPRSRPVKNRMDPGPTGYAGTTTSCS